MLYFDSADHHYKTSAKVGEPQRQIRTGDLKSSNIGKV
jgi:hypothetical protein